jgi:hypothetical protein
MAITGISSHWHSLLYPPGIEVLESIPSLSIQKEDNLCTTAGTEGAAERVRDENTSNHTCGG